MSTSNVYKFLTDSESETNFLLRYSAFQLVAFCLFPRFLFDSKQDCKDFVSLTFYCGTVKDYQSFLIESFLIFFLLSRYRAFKISILKLLY